MPSHYTTHTTFNPRLVATHPGMDTSQWGNMPHEQMMRTKYIIAYMEGKSRAAAKRIAGVRGKNYHSQVLKHLKKHGSLAEAEHHRAPTKYTDAVLAEAMQELIDNQDTPMNAPEFVQFLEEKQILKAPTDCYRFTSALVAYVESQGCTLLTHDTATTFAIKEQSAEERVTVSKELLCLMDSSVPLENWIFEDETTIEESPHPKGEAAVHMHLRVSRHAWSQASMGLHHHDGTRQGMLWQCKTVAACCSSGTS